MATRREGKTMKTTTKVLLAVFSWAASACSQSQTPTNETNALGPGRAAVVNGQAIAESVLRVYALATEGKNLDELTAEQRGNLVEDLIGVELLRQQAVKEGLTDSRALAAQLELQRLQLLARAMATSYLEKNPATEAELQQLYDENLPRLASRQYKARHILLETREEADAVIAELGDGKEFLAVARERASGPTGPNGGDLGWFTAESMVQPVVDAASAMQVGTYSREPIQTEFGFHVLLLEDSRQQEPPPLADLRTELAGAIERKRLEDYLSTLRDGATISLEP